MLTFLVIAALIFIVFVLLLSFSPTTPPSPEALAKAARTQKGKDTERQAVALMKTAIPAGWRLEHGVKLTRGGDFDLVLHGPARQKVVVEIKSHAGRPSFRPDGHFYLGRDLRDYVYKQIQGQMEESGTKVILWQPLAGYGTLEVAGLTCVSGEDARNIWDLATRTG